MGLLNTALSAIRKIVGGAASPGITSHSPLSGPASTVVTVTGVGLPTSGWGTSVWLVIDDDLGVNTVDRSSNVVSTDDTELMFTIGGIGPGTSRDHVRITNISPTDGSLYESPSGGITRTA